MLHSRHFTHITLSPASVTSYIHTGSTFNTMSLSITSRLVPGKAILIKLDLVSGEGVTYLQGGSEPPTCGSEEG